MRKNRDIREENKSSIIKPNGALIEMVYDRQQERTQFVEYWENNTEYRDFIEASTANPIKYYPYPPDNDLIKNGVILFPSKVENYGDDKSLVLEIQSFINKYLDISPLFEKIASYYVLFTWVYDCFNELPYLRALGDTGSGKSRFLKVIGSLCYKPMFTAGATTTSPIFRIINDFNGTLVLDEADLRISDAKTDMIKILNCGYSKGVPVLRSVENKGKDFSIRSFNVFCPKLFATRGRFEDNALESRCLIEEMGNRRLRKDIPLNIPETFDAEATAIRNKLLMWRFINFGKKKIDSSLEDRSIEPRLNQIIIPLASIINDSELVGEIKKFVKAYDRQLIADRGMKDEAELLEIIIDLRNDGDFEPTIKEITEKYNSKLSEHDKKLSYKKAGWIIREKLKLKPVKTREGYVISCNDKDVLDTLISRYGIENNKSEQVNVENIVNVVEDESNINNLPL